MDIQGKGYGGGQGTTSTTGTELLSAIPGYSNWRYYELSFLNSQDCTLTINKQWTFPVKSGVGFEMDNNDQPITSLVVNENGIAYQWQGKWV